MATFDLVNSGGRDQSSSYKAPQGDATVDQVASLGYITSPEDTGAADTPDDGDLGKTGPTDIERGSEHGATPKGRKPTRLLRCKQRVKSVTSRLGSPFGIVLGLLALAAFGGVVFGASVGVEKGLTGEPFWAPGHRSLFRICESPTTTGAKGVNVHTCNVFRPSQDVNSAPLHSFTEFVRPWQQTTRAATPGLATRVDPVRLDALLLSRGLRCSPANPSATRPNSDAQILIGGVGQMYTGHKSGIACNYDQDGRNTQDHCGSYGDGGEAAFAKSHPLSINEIFGRHFGMNCSWA